MSIFVNDKNSDNEREDRIQEESRRALLRSLGLAGTVTGGYSMVSGFIGVASASSDDQEPNTGAGKDQRIAPPGSYGPSDEEYEAAREEDAERYSDDVSFVITDIPNPRDLPFDICTSVGDGEELCVSTSDIFIAEREDCYGNKTPRLVSCDVSATLFEYGNVSWETEFFIGVDEDECVWVGHPETEVCATVVGCDMVEKVDNVVFAPGPIIDAAENYGDWVNEHPDIVVGAAAIGIMALVALYLGISAAIIAVVKAALRNGIVA